MQPQLSQTSHTPNGDEPILPPEQYTWWEKTIEYLFVSKHLNNYEFAMPLAGNHEKLGDTAFAKNARWIAIEFKRGIKGGCDSKGIEAMRQSEVKKFPKPREVNYKKAGEILCRNYGSTDGGINHHFIVYGVLDDSRVLQLKSHRYFSTPESDVAVEKAISMGIDIDTFFEYINDFTLKKRSDKRPSPNSPLGGPDFGIVIGVSSNCFTAMTMTEFIAYKSDRKKEKQDAERQSHRNILLNDGIEPEQLITKLDESEHKKKKQDRAGRGRIYKKAASVTLENDEKFDKQFRTSTKNNHNANEN